MANITLFQIQNMLAEGWTLETYSEEFKAGSLPHRDFEHALIHVMKATGKLAAMVDKADHKRESPMSPFPTQEVANYLADLVICAIRMASKGPLGPINLEEAVIARIKEKANVPVVN